jgi:hypothetical protein
MEHAGMKKQTERALKKLAGNGYPDVREALEEIERQAREIGRLREQQAMILAAKEVTIAPPHIPEGFVIDTLNQANLDLHAEIARQRGRLQEADRLSGKLKDICAEQQAEIERLRELLARCEPHVHGNVAEWRKFLGPQYSGSAHQAATWRIADGEELLREIAEALGDD